MDEQQIRAALARYPFYHVIPLPGGMQTPGWAQPEVLRTQGLVLRALRGLELNGRRVLDVGCRDGLFSFEAEKRGAADVIGIDNDLSPGATEFLIPYLGSRVRMAEMNLYDLTPGPFGRFDVVVCAGVLYHLRFPFWGLKRLRDVLRPGGTLILETALLVDDNRKAVLHCPVGAESPYEPTSCTFFNAKGLVDTLRSLGLEAGRVTYLNHLPEYRDRLKPRVKRWLQTLLGVRRPPIIDRAVVVCRLAAVDPTVASGRVLDYWHGTHRVHTLHRGDLADGPADGRPAETAVEG